MIKTYFTIGFEQPNGPGVVSVEGATSDDCRVAVYKFTKGRFAFQYDSWGAIHHLDRKLLVELEAVTSEDKPGATLPKVRLNNIGDNIKSFEGYEHAV